jgi:acetyl-CoA acyltransferase
VERDEERSVNERSFVIGVGMTPFVKPGSRGWDYHDMGRVAAGAALADADVSYDAVQQVVAGYVYGESTCGQRAVYELGLTGIPVVNVNNNCSTGSTALSLARQLVEGGLVDCALAVGFEKMETGSIQARYTDRALPVERHYAQMIELRGYDPTAPPGPQLFGNVGREHMERHGTTKEQFVRIAEKNHRHSANNPNAQFQQIYTVEEILASPLVYEPLHRLMCSPTSDGAAAAVVASESFVHALGLEDRAVEIVAQELVTDVPATFSARSCASIAGADMTAFAAKRLFGRVALTIDDVDVIELHDQHNLGLGGALVLTLYQPMVR